MIEHNCWVHEGFEFLQVNDAHKDRHKAAYISLMLKTFMREPSLTMTAKQQETFCLVKLHKLLSRLETFGMQWIRELTRKCSRGRQRTETGIRLLWLLDERKSWSLVLCCPLLDRDVNCSKRRRWDSGPWGGNATCCEGNSYFAGAISIFSQLQ